MDFLEPQTDPFNPAERTDLLAGVAIVQLRFRASGGERPSAPITRAEEAAFKHGHIIVAVADGQCFTVASMAQSRWPPADRDHATAAWRDLCPHPRQYLENGRPVRTVAPASFKRHTKADFALRRAQPVHRFAVLTLVGQLGSLEARGRSPPPPRQRQKSGIEGVKGFKLALKIRGSFGEKLLPLGSARHIAQHPKPVFQNGVLRLSLKIAAGNVDGRAILNNKRVAVIELPRAGSSLRQRFYW